MARLVGKPNLRKPMVYFDPKILPILKENTKNSGYLLWLSDNLWRRYIPVPDENGLVHFRFPESRIYGILHLPKR